jgi:GNAT superfamily N-acetyltransferase
MATRAAQTDDAAAIASVYAQSWRETYTGRIPERIIEARTAVEKRRAQWSARLGEPRAADIIFVNEQDSVIRGFLWIVPRSAVEERERGPGNYLSALYVLANAHGRGIGRELLGAGARVMLSRGQLALSFGVLAANPARAFYEHLGAQYISTSTIHDGADRWDQCTYEWPDVTPLSS